MAKWKVREGTQVKWDGKLLAAGDSFSASEAQVEANGLSGYVEPVAEKKAQTSSANKAQSKSDNK